MIPFNVTDDPNPEKSVSLGDLDGAELVWEDQDGNEHRVEL